MPVMFQLPVVFPPACRAQATPDRGRTRVSTAFAGMMLTLSLAVPSAQAQSTDIANVPMAVSSMVTPNVLVMLDNSQSMDALMGGVLVSGNNANTRSNIGRGVMRNAITNFRNSFNWGLMSYGMSTNPPTLNSTYAYYLGSNTGMVFTANCTGYVAGVFNGAPAIPGVSTDGGGRCIANPQPSPGRGFVTFDLSSDDSNIVDALYFGAFNAGGPARNQLWAPASNTANPTTYSWYDNHSTTVDSWNIPADFSSFFFSSTLTPTDAGFVPGNFGAALPNNISRSLYMPRGWGYISNVSGSGTLNRAVQADSAAHFTALQTLLGNETTGATGEVKNGAVFTTLKGTVDTAKSYFSGALTGNTTPVAQTCQKNFIMMVTDGLPTGTTAGALYPAVARTNTCNWDTTTNACTSGGFGTAATDLISSVSALRTTTVPGLSSTDKDGTGAVTGKYDVQTYVVALGETVANAQALSVMNALGNAGGTGAALPANDATAFANAITRISDSITAKVGASAAVAVANAHVTSLDNASFATSYNSGTWTGDIDSFAIDVATGIPSTTSLWSGGSASTQLDARTSANRYLATSIDTAGAIGGVQFQPSAATIGGAVSSKISVAQQTLLNTTSTTDGAAVLAYLRGDRSGETAGTYRPRVHLLGDMINGEPVLVREPSAGYADTGYVSFASTNASRTRMLYQGANDGMLHAYVASTGAEAWAYIPNLVMGSLNNLSSKTGFTHQYYVDGTPVAGDVDFKQVDGATGSGTDWRTVLVGGPGKGGRGYYALDITSPIAASEANLASKVLWEFPNSITNATVRNTARLNMGFSYGKPVIVKTKAKGWVVLVTSGYNNGTNSGDSGGDGLGHLYVVNPKTGDLLQDIVTTGCTGTPASNPCGLAQLSAYVSNGADNTAEYVYGGDLKGNVWRFDFTGSSLSNWSVARFAQLKDASGNGQPVTTSPELALVGTQRMVYVGTGLYLGTSDVPGATGANASSSQTQSMYGLKDVLTSTLPTPLRTTLQVQTFTTTATTRTATNNPVNYATQNGWYIDFPTTGERLNTDPTIALGALIFTTNIPSSVVCQPGGSSWEYFINLKTGGLVDYSTVGYSGVFLGNALASRPVLIQLPSGKVVSLVRTSDAKTLEKDVPVAPPSAGARRISWRELFK
jgi:type IV pilus assembly protein PilY1